MNAKAQRRKEEKKAEPDAPNRLRGRLVPPNLSSSSLTFASLRLRVHPLFCRFALFGLFLVSGCTVHPAGEAAERSAAAGAGAVFAKRFEQRAIAPLPAGASAEEMVRYALVSNPQVERRYWEWRSALEQIPLDGTQATTLVVTGGTTVTRGRADAGASTLGLGNDPMADIQWPGKLSVAARRALENARAAGRRFRKAQLDVRARVLGAYEDLALDAELARLQESNTQLLHAVSLLAQARNVAGSGDQADLLKARNEEEMALNDLQSLRADAISRRAALNAALGRTVDAPFDPPRSFAEPRALGGSDTEILSRAAQNNPELAALADEVRARTEAIQLAGLQYVPDFDLSVGSDLRGIAQSLSAMLTVPILKHEAIEASIAQAKANERSAEAMSRQSGNDVAAAVAGDLAGLHDADRQIKLLRESIVPRARQAVQLVRSSYESGRGTLLDVLDSERSLNALQRLQAELTVTREKKLLDLETQTGTLPSGG